MLVLANLFLAFNFIYEGSLWNTDKNRIAPYFNEFQDALTSAEVLYLGDCSDQFFRPYDASFQSIAGYLNEALPNDSVRSVSRDGFHALAYEKLLQRWRKRDSTTVKTLVVTLNMRSFAPHIRLHKNENTLQRNLTLVERHPPLFNRVEIGFRAHPYMEAYEMEEALEEAWQQPYPQDEFVHRDFPPGYTPEQFRASLLANATSADDSLMISSYVEHYGLPLNINEHPLLLAFDNIAAIGAERYVNVVYVLLPENSMEARQYAGDRLADYMEWKREYLVQRYESMGVHVVDVFDLLQPVDFVEKIPNSHYTAEGRQRIASAIAERIPELPELLDPDAKDNESLSNDRIDL